MIAHIYLEIEVDGIEKEDTLRFWSILFYNGKRLNVNYCQFRLESTNLFPFNTLKFILSHIVCKTLVSIAFNHVDTGGSVGFKDKCKDFGYKVVKLFAFHRVWEFFTIGAAGITMLYIAGTNFTPCCFFVTSASGAWAFKVSITRTAVKSAVSNLFCVGYNFFHMFGFLWVFEGKKTEDRSLKTEVGRSKSGIGYRY